MLIPTSRFGRRVRRRLRQEIVAWLTTVDRRGTPQPRPIWFHWDGETFLIFSQPDTGKLRHIARDPRVAVHLNSDVNGDDFAVLLGKARLPRRPVPPERLRAYLRKYRQGILGLGLTPESFLAEYSVPILVKPERLRGG